MAVATSKRMMACLLMSQSVGAIIGAIVFSNVSLSWATQKIGPVVTARYYFECCIEGTDSSALLRSGEIDAVEGISRNAALATRKAGEIRRDQRPPDRPETFQTFPDVRAAHADVHARNRRALLQAVNIIRLSDTDVLGFELAHDIGDLASIIDTEVEQRAARKREIL
jgi:hypothetical protein